MSERPRPDVTRAEAQELLRHLKLFAFSVSPELERGETPGIEITRKVFHDDPIPEELLYSVEPDVSTTTFGFEAHRVPPVRKKRSFRYSVWAAVEHTVHELDAGRRALIEDYNPENDMYLETMDEGALTETITARFDLSDHELRTITPVVSRVLRLTSDMFEDGSTVLFRSSTQEILDEEHTDLIEEEIPPQESFYEADRIFVPEHIDHESLSPADAVENDILFWDTVRDEKGQFDDGGVPYNSAVHQIRTILRGVRGEKHGI